MAVVELVVVIAALQVICVPFWLADMLDSFAQTFSLVVSILSKQIAF